MCVLDVYDMRKKILLGNYSSRYSIHLEAIEMYCDLWEVNSWNRMKKNITKFMDKCPNCQQVNVEQQKSRGYSQDISIPTCKSEDLNMDFIVGLARTRWKHDSIWVIV